MYSTTARADLAQVRCTLLLDLTDYILSIFSPLVSWELKSPVLMGPAKETRVLKRMWRFLKPLESLLVQTSR